MNEQLFATLKDTMGMYIPLYADRGGVNNLRRTAGAKSADHPAQLMRDKNLRKQEHK
jgi:hypothetical protein